jgi:hypothetical protein
VTESDAAAVGGCAMMVAIIITLYVVSVAVFHWAWNFVMAGLFGVPAIKIWHAVAIITLLGFIRGGVQVVRK